MSDFSALSDQLWKSTEHELAIRFNKRIWSIVVEAEENGESMFGLMDRTDGTSFVMNVEDLEDSDLIDPESLEAVLFKDLFNKDNAVKFEGRGKQSLCGADFHYAKYRFHNEKFGIQNVFHFIRQNGRFVFLIACAWPQSVEPMPNNLLPGKLNILFKGLDAPVFA